jgi:hypothetical protein
LFFTADAVEVGTVVSLGCVITSEDVTAPNIAAETLAPLLRKMRAAKRVCRSSRHFII